MGVEGDAGTGSHFTHGARCAHFSRACEITDAFGDADGETDDVVGSDLDLAQVDTGTYLQTHVPCLGHDLDGGAHRAGCGIEGGEEPVREMTQTSILTKTSFHCRVTFVTPTIDASPTRGHKKKGRTRAALIDAAIDVISDQPGGFSVGDVTAWAGVSQGTFYNYFDDRDTLIDAVVPEVLTRFAVESAELVAIDEPVERFATLTTMALRMAADAPHEVRVLLRLDAVHRAIVEAPVLDHMRTDLLAGYRSGAFISGPDASSLDVIVGAILVGARRITDEAVPAEYVPRLVASLLRSLGVAAGPATEVADRVARSVDEIRRVSSGSTKPAPTRNAMEVLASSPTPSPSSDRLD